MNKIKKKTNKRIISFIPLGNENLEELISLAEEALPGADSEEIRDALCSFVFDEDEDAEAAVSFSGGCLLVRIFDTGRYIFVYPIAMEDRANEDEAIEDIRAYSVREEIPLVFSDIPREELTRLISHFRHANVDALDPDREVYRAEIKSECSLISEIPTLALDDISIGQIGEEDIPSMAALARDCELNKYWGYDYRADAPNAPDSYFYETALHERRLGTSLTLAIRREGKYIGEALLYAFDFSGSAEIGVRILREHQGRGYARQAIGGLISLAERLGLTSLSATVAQGNEVSLRLISSIFDKISEDEEKVYYKLEL